MDEPRSTPVGELQDRVSKLEEDVAAFHAELKEGFSLTGDLLADEEARLGRLEHAVASIMGVLRKLGMSALSESAIDTSRIRKNGS